MSDWMQTSFVVSAATDTYTLNDFFNWLGRWHLLVLHTPIGLLAGVWALDLAMLARKGLRPGLSAASSLVLLLTALSAIAAAVLGWLLQRSNPKAYGGELLDAHLLWGIATAVVLSLLWVVRDQAGRRKGWLFKGAYPVGLLVSTGLMSLTGHTGGSAVHSESFLTRGAPPFIQNLLEDNEPEAPSDPAPTDIEGAASTSEDVDGTASALDTEIENTTEANTDNLVDDAEAVAGDLYTAVIHPIFATYCLACHDPDQKVKGGLDMTTMAAMLEGGKSGMEGIIPGNPDESEIFYRMNLPHDDIDIMPPEGDDPVPADKIQQVREWILAGALMPGQ